MLSESLIPSFGRLHHVGSRHAQFVDTPGEDIEVTEKVDGSQFSWMLDLDGVLHFRSKRAVINPHSPGMFEAGVRSIQDRRDLFVPGVVYRGEYLRAPKHNANNYARIPQGHVYLFRVDTGPEDFASSVELEHEAKRLGLEPPRFLPSMSLDYESVLGGCKIEGYVVKNFSRACPMSGKFPLMAKCVSPAFREIAGGEWKKMNPNTRDIVDQLAEEVCTEARMEKAVQHLAEQGLLDNSPKDIGALMKELAEDIRVEASEYIAERLLRHYLPHVTRKAAKQFPEWYRRRIGYGV